MRGWLGLLARLVVGNVWLYAGWLKVGDPAASTTAVRAYQLLPPDVADAVGRVLPAVEIGVGLLLVLGLLSRIAAVVSALLLAAFVVGIVSVWLRGIPIDCGCFGGGGYDPDAFAQYPWEIARDVGLLLASAFVLVVRRTRLALDNVVFPA
ncbi:MauE/DoxX family redox-associated membrane protein [Nocardioides aurantiacus]|uniref:Methylamine utilization protein MauE n=1 Tax=Nocardioides aurantiacus TaxID=86796 RepID=A0A3N2CVY7_9ACTN|nr:MauE/DoxX family redox-associated membrane protein [Nocardioides aurantiacus]ROR91707.1 methylamine utilization protein MauE [Nocardioides aurantiacus]